MLKKAIGLFSGGLDSVLSCKIICDLGFDVIALNFSTIFQKEKNYESLPADYFFDITAGDFFIKQIDINSEFLKMLITPQYGYGKNINPCIDCKILFIKYALKMMREINAEFVFTGEVVGQRPKSQKKNTLELIDKRVESNGYLLRPLSAKLLKPTVPELQGIIDRNKLFDFSGRSRKPQTELAQRLGVRNYGQPAGGCLLTDPIFSDKLKFLIANNLFTFKNILFLKLGRNFWLADNKAQLVIGRNQSENKKIYEQAEKDDILIIGHPSNNTPGPTAILLVDKNLITSEILQQAASMTAKYYDNPEKKKLKMLLFNKSKVTKIIITVDSF